MVLYSVTLGLDKCPLGKGSMTYLLWLVIMILFFNVEEAPSPLQAGGRQQRGWEVAEGRYVWAVLGGAITSKPPWWGARKGWGEWAEVGP